MKDGVLIWIMTDVEEEGKLKLGQTFLFAPSCMSD